MPAPDLTPEQHALLDSLADSDPGSIEYKAMLEVLLEPGFEEAFLMRYFGESFSAKLEDFHMRLIDTALYEQRGEILFPAGHGKTTLVSGKLPILEVIRSPNTRISIIAKNDNEATAIMSSIKTELEQNELLIADYGPFRPADGDPMRVWKTEALSVVKRTRRGKEHTIAVFGAGSRQILGWRSDWVICDDVVTEKNSATPDQRDKHKTWFDDCVMTSPQKMKAGERGGRITVVGTMFHPKDLYAYIQSKVDADGEKVFKWHREDAIRDESQELPLWPEVWSWQDLMNVKHSEGTLSFNKRYRNKPVDESEQPFKENHIRGDGEHPGCLHPEIVLGDYEQDWRIFQCFDPAIGVSSGAKFCGHIVFGIDPLFPRRRILLEINRLQLTLSQQRDLIIQTHMNWAAKAQMSMSIVETNAYQKGLQQVIQERCQELGLTMRLEGHQTGLNKQDPQIGIPSMATLVENGDLWFPTGNPESFRKSWMLAEEMIEYPFFAYSDLLMALWFGHLRSQTAVPVFKTQNRLKENSRYRPVPGRKTIRNPLFSAQTPSVNSIDAISSGADHG